MILLVRSVKCLALVAVCMSSPVPAAEEIEFTFGTGDVRACHKSVDEWLKRCRVGKKGSCEEGAVQLRAGCPLRSSEPLLSIRENVRPLDFRLNAR